MILIHKRHIHDHHQHRGRLSRLVPRVLWAMDDVGFILLGIFGAACFPLFYFLWHVLFGLPEILWPRIVGMLICLPLIFAGFWSARARVWLPVYGYVAALYCLPFFFVHQLLCVDDAMPALPGAWRSVDVVWMLSTVSALFITYLMLDRCMLRTLFGFTVGSLAALLVAVVSGAHINIARGLELCPVLAFWVVGSAAVGHVSRGHRAEDADADAPTPQAPADLGAPMNLGTCSETFAGLLAGCFNESELRHFIRYLDPTLVARLPGGGTPLATLASEAVALLERVDQVDRALDQIAQTYACHRGVLATLRRAYHERRRTLS